MGDKTWRQTYLYCDRCGKKRKTLKCNHCGMALCETCHKEMYGTGKCTVTASTEKGGKEK